jgi:stage II sporulation protein D
MAGPGKVKSAQFTVIGKEQKFSFAGRGFGHGAGMSQWGACQMARKGHSFDQILQFYYPGTKTVQVQYKVY